jgi:sterol 3beta-glucosyltransferase
MAVKKGLLLTYGTRGDVEPFIALAQGLQTSGVDVLIAAPKRFSDWVQSFGLACCPLSDASLALIDTPDGKTMFEGGFNLFRRIAAGIRLAKKSSHINQELMQETWNAAEAFRPEFIVFHSKLMTVPHVAEKLRVQAFLAALQPMIVPTRAFPAMGLPRFGLPAYNRMSYALVERAFGAYRKNISRFRRETLGLPPIVKRREVLFPRSTAKIPVLHAFSSNVIPRPADWPDEALITGYWRLQNVGDYTPPTELADFLEAGPQPVFVGFGSMPSVDPSALGNLVVGALRKANQRGVISKGWANLNLGKTDDMILIDSVPYDWLFPRMVAVVHHGGAGTTAAGFHAGVPSVICPFVADQRGWADISFNLGVGTRPIPRRRLTEEQLASSIRVAVSSTQMRENATHLAEQLAKEDGVRNAISIIRETLRELEQSC